MIVQFLDSSALEEGLFSCKPVINWFLIKNIEVNGIKRTDGGMSSDVPYLESNVRELFSI